VFVACSTLCFASDPLEAALRHIAELEFDKVELAVVEDGGHLRPSEVGDDPEAAYARLRRGPALSVSALHLDFGPVDWSDPVQKKRFDNHCRFAKALNVAVLTMAVAPSGTPLEAEAARLSALSATAMREGLVLAALTQRQAVTGDPAAALKLCQDVPGLALTLDPSHFVGSAKDAEVERLYPFVQNVHLRDTGKGPDEFQVRIGQGRIDYARIVNLLNRGGYKRALTVAVHDRQDDPDAHEVEVRKLKLLLETLL